MASKEDLDLNLEYATLVSLTDKLVLGISMDQSVVAQKLMAKGVIPPMSLDPPPTAAAIFDNVLKAVELNSKNFEKLQHVIKECPCIKYLAEEVQQTYEEKLQQQAREKVQCECVIFGKSLYDQPDKCIQWCRKEED